MPGDAVRNHIADFGFSDFGLNNILCFPFLKELYSDFGAVQSLSYKRLSPV